MLKKYFVIMFLLILPVFTVANSFQSNSSLYSDSKAHSVGDIVTIYIVEQSSSTNKTGSNKDSNKGISVGLDTEGTSDFSGLSLSGSFSNNSEQRKQSYSQERLETKISAKIVQRDTVGNFLIRGEKAVVVNGVKKTTVLTGVIRPDDINSDNIIYSYNISNSKITHTGVTKQEKKQSILQKIANWIF